jgi:hypothetical protein
MEVTHQGDVFDIYEHPETKERRVEIQFKSRIPQTREEMNSFLDCFGHFTFQPKTQLVIIMDGLDQLSVLHKLHMGRYMQHHRSELCHYIVHTQIQYRSLAARRWMKAFFKLFPPVTPVEFIKLP